MDDVMYAMRIDDKNTDCTLVLTCKGNGKFTLGINDDKGMVEQEFSIEYIPTLISFLEDMPIRYEEYLSNKEKEND